uniref:Ovnp18 n=1 Tax=Ophionotus victoriae TaxID=667017 RepID=A0A220W0E9_9ECHI|nr:Ovnp18 precursor [Ophionotus victoriae]
MQSSNIAVVATLFIFAAVFAQAAYSLSFEAPQRSKRLFWVDKKAETSQPDKRLFWVDKKTPEKRLFWVDKKTPEKRLFWVDKKSDGEHTNVDALAHCFVKVFSNYMDHVAECKTAGVDNLQTCMEAVKEKSSMANANCLSDPEGGL